MSTKLVEIPCSNCGGAGLELQPDGRAVCRFCGTPNVLAGPVCPRCEHVNSQSAEICENCGQALTRRCPQCQTKNWSGAERCLNCGRALDTLDHLMTRLQEKTEGHFDRQQRDSRAIKAEEEAAAQRRSAYFMELEERRQQALAEAKRRSERERQIMQRLVVAFTLIVILSVAAFAVVSFLR
jgi:hypothetical protein